MLSLEEERVIENINSNVGKDVENLQKSKNLIVSYEEHLKFIEEKLAYKCNTGSSKIKDALKRQVMSKEAIDFESEKISFFENKLSKRIVSCDRIIGELSSIMDTASNIEHVLEYLKIVGDIQDINAVLELTINGKDEAKIVGAYLSLYGEHYSENSICGRLQNVDAQFLKAFALNTAIYWHDILQAKFSKDFESLLKIIKWPQQGQLSNDFCPSKNIMNKLSTLAEILLLIKTPANRSNNLLSITPSILCPRISILTELLLKQFRQRFQYHFNGSRQTNRLDKPEWFYTKILNWAKENHLFIGKNFQPAAVIAGLENFNVRLEFIRGLVQLCVQKLAVDIEVISKDERLFAHLIDETLAFEHDLGESLGYPPTFPSAITVVTQPEYLLQWISVEERFSTGKMDLMFQDEDPWTFIDPSNIEILKIPKCADQFIRLLDSIRERYSNLPQPGQQLQFLHLQLELIDNFRRRLVQLHACGNVDSTKVLNAINYIISVLREWGENVHYLHLNASLMGPNASDIGSVFEKPIEELEHWQRKLVKDLSLKIVAEIKAKSMPYRHDNWMFFPEQNSKEPFILSTTAGEMFQVMLPSLHNLETDLSSNVFGIALRIIAHHLDEFFLDSLVMNTKFSIGGATQFQFDMTRNLFPLFGQYTRKPELLFKRVNDACILLNMPLGNALLLLQTLSDDIVYESKLSALKEVGIINLKPIICIDILDRRTDSKLFLNNT